jgi:hypothetical protein
MTYVYWHEPERSPAAATVSKPVDLKALAKQTVEKQSTEAQEIAYPPDERMTNIRIAGARRQKQLIQIE